MQTDSELVKSCLIGQKQAFGVLVRRYERLVRAAAIDVLKDPQSIQDAAQDAFILAYEKLPNLRKTELFGPWLLKITRRCALDIARKKTKQAPLDSSIDYPAESSDGQLDEEKQNLLAAVLKLPEGQRQAVMLRYFSEMSVKEVSYITGRSVGTVTKQISRAHRRLRKILKESEK